MGRSVKAGEAVFDDDVVGNDRSYSKSGVPGRSRHRLSFLCRMAPDAGVKTAPRDIQRLG
jgi:hypothetical protein